MIYPYNRTFSGNTSSNVDDPKKHYAKSKQPDTKGHLLHGSMSMKCPKQGIHRLSIVEGGVEGY